MSGWEDLEIGTQSGTFDGVIEDAMVDNYLKAMGNTLDLYKVQPDGSRIVPPDLVPRLAMRPLFSHFVRARVGHSIRAKHHVRYYRPYHVGDRIQVTGYLIDKYVRRDKQFMVFEAKFDLDGHRMLHDVRTIMVLGQNKPK